MPNEDIVSVARWTGHYQSTESVEIFFMYCIQQGGGLKKVGIAGSCSFLTDSCKFPTEEIMGAQNLNFLPLNPPQVGTS